IRRSDHEVSELTHRLPDPPTGCFAVRWTGDSGAVYFARRLTGNRYFRTAGQRAAGTPEPCYGHDVAIQFLFFVLQPFLAPWRPDHWHESLAYPSGQCRWPAAAVKPQHAARGDRFFFAGYRRLRILVGAVRYTAAQLARYGFADQSGVRPERHAINLLRRFSRRDATTSRQSRRRQTSAQVLPLTGQTPAEY